MGVLSGHTKKLLLAAISTLFAFTVAADAQERDDLLRVAAMALKGEVTQAEAGLPLYTLIRQRVESRVDGFDEYEYRLQLEKDSSEFLLGRLLHKKPYGHELGFDADSLRLKWVVHEMLLQVQWHTLWLGKIGAVVHSIMLLRRTPSGWEHLFRDNSTAYPGRRECGLGFLYDTDERSMYFSEVRPSDSNTVYNVVAIWPCTVETDGLRLADGLLVYRCRGDAQVAEIAGFASTACHGVPDKIGMTEEKLRNLNPRFESDADSPKLVVIEAPLKAYEPDTKVYYHLSETSSITTTRDEIPPPVIRR